MLKLFRRHTLNCPHSAKGRSFKKCSCPLWAEGTRGGKRIRKSLDTANLEIAAERLLKMEAGEEAEQNRSPEDAVKDFIKDCNVRNLAKPTIGKYEEALDPLVDWADSKGISTVRALLKLDVLKTYLPTLKDSPLTVGKKIERIRTFNRFCEELEWCKGIAAQKLKRPIVKSGQVVPFTKEELDQMFAAIDDYPTKNSYRYDNRRRLRAFLYILRYTGLRISDAVRLPRSAVKDGKLLLQTHKRGTMVHIPVPEFVIKELEQVGNEKHFFWSGNGEVKSAVSRWQRSIATLFEKANVSG